MKRRATLALSALAAAEIGVLAFALSGCGFRLGDPELENALYWVRDFKAEHPEQARAIGWACKQELTHSLLSRDGALALFSCIRGKAAARGLA